MHQQLEKLFEDLKARQREMEELSAYLFELESQLSLIFAASPDLIIFISKDGKILKISQAVSRILGYQKDELLGKHIWDFIHPDDIEKIEVYNNIFIEEFDDNILKYIDISEHCELDNAYEIKEWLGDNSVIVRY